MARITLRPLLCWFVAFQLVLSAPLASALAARVLDDASRHAGMPCDDMDMQAAQPDATHCPCCPDGDAGARNCQTACAAGGALMSSPQYHFSSPVAVPAAEPPQVIFHPLADRPLKPPQITHRIT